MGRGRAPCCDKSKVKKGPWSPAEDLRLINFIQNYGHGNWRALPKQAGLLRCGKSCRLRWINYLRPDLKRGNFTAEEEETIIKLHSSLGNKWSKIASHVPGRTDNEIKNVWNTHLKKRYILTNAENVYKEDEIKDSSMIYSSSLSSSTSSIVSSRDQSVKKELDQNDHSPKRTRKNQDHLEITPQRSLIEPKESSSSSSSFSCAPNLLNSGQVDFERPYQVGNVLYGEDTNQDIPNEDVEIPFDPEIDLWNLLDNLDSFQCSELQMDELVVSKSSNSREECDNNNEADRFRKWLKDLENELGLVTTTSDEQQSPFDEVVADELKAETIYNDLTMAKPDLDSPIACFPIWPPSPTNFGTF